MEKPDIFLERAIEECEIKCDLSLIKHVIIKAMYAYGDRAATDAFEVGYASGYNDKADEIKKQS